MNDVIANMVDELKLDKESLLMLKELMKEYQGREIELLTELAQYTYDEMPVDTYKFVTDPYYLGMKGQVYPKILDDLCELFDSGQYVEAVLTGGIGWGKSTFAEIALCKMVYDVSCFKNPQKAYGLANGTKISFVNVSVSLDQAKKVVFHGLKQKLGNSPYFNSKFRMDANLVESMRFPKQVEIFPTTDPIGLNVFGGIIDEINFMGVIEKSKANNGKRYDHAQDLHDNLIRRMKSRFMKQGKLPGVLLNISSSKYPDDFTERFMAQSREDPTVFIRRYSQWATKPKSFYIGEYFKVSLGDSILKPEIIVSDDKGTIEQKIEMYKSKEIDIIDVPIEYRKDFETDLDGSIRDIAGRPTLTVKPFILNTESIFTAIDKGQAMGLAHPFSAEYTTLRDGVKILPELLPKDKRHPRFVHVDLALTGDSCGFCMGHVAGYSKVIRRNEEGNEYKETVPDIVIDILLEIRPPYKGEIQIADVRALIYELRSYGFFLQAVSFDQFQSRDSMQQLKSRGINAEYMSADVSLEPYTSLKNALYEGRLAMYEYKKVITELRRLEMDEFKGKVDHPSNGSKDIADALACVVHHCSTKTPSVPIAPVIGSTVSTAELRVEEAIEKRKHEKGTRDALDRMMDDLM